MQHCEANNIVALHDVRVWNNAAGVRRTIGRRYGRRATKSELHVQQGGCAQVLAQQKRRYEKRSLPRSAEAKC